MFLGFIDRATATPPPGAPSSGGAPSTGDAPVDGAFAATLAGLEADSPAKSSVPSNVDPLALAMGLLLGAPVVPWTPPSSGPGFIDGRVELSDDDAEASAVPEGPDDSGDHHPVEDTCVLDAVAAATSVTVAATPILTLEMHLSVTATAVDACSAGTLAATEKAGIGAGVGPAGQPTVPGVPDLETRDSGRGFRQAQAALSLVQPGSPSTLSVPNGSKGEIQGSGNRERTQWSPAVSGGGQDVTEGMLTLRDASSPTVSAQPAATQTLPQTAAAQTLPQITVVQTHPSAARAQAAPPVAAMIVLPQTGTGTAQTQPSAGPGQTLPPASVDSVTGGGAADVPVPSSASTGTRLTYTAPARPPAGEVPNTVQTASEQAPADPRIAGAAVAAAVIPSAFVRADQAQTGATPVQADIDPAPAAAATTTGGDLHAEDQPAQGDGRRSPEFARLIAALSLNAPRSDDSGRAPATFGFPSLPEVTGTSFSSSAVAAAAPAAASPSTDAENVNRLVQTMRIYARPGAWEATVRLKPDHLGEVTISLRVEGNVVSAIVEAEGAGVRQWLEAQEQAVRSGMATHGLHLDRFVVQRDGQRAGHEAPEQDPRRRSPRRAPVSAERFEIIV